MLQLFHQTLAVPALLSHVQSFALMICFYCSGTFMYDGFVPLAHQTSLNLHGSLIVQQANQIEVCETTDKGKAFCRDSHSLADSGLHFQILFPAPLLHSRQHCSCVAM